MHSKSRLIFSGTLLLIVTIFYFMPYANAAPIVQVFSGWLFYNYEAGDLSKYFVKIEYTMPAEGKYLEHAPGFIETNDELSAKAYWSSVIYLYDERGQLIDVSDLYTRISNCTILTSYRYGQVYSYLLFRFNLMSYCLIEIDSLGKMSEKVVIHYSNQSELPTLLDINKDGIYEIIIHKNEHSNSNIWEQPNIVIGGKPIEWSSNSKSVVLWIEPRIACQYSFASVDVITQK